MPQIANQDYNVIRPEYANDVSVDAIALSKLSAHRERGTIFDVVIVDANIDDPTFSRVLDYNKQSMNVPGKTIDVPYSPDNYIGLSAIQREMQMEDALPYLYLVDPPTEPYLAENGRDTLICVDGFKVIGEIFDDKFISFTVSSEKVAPETEYGSGYVNISEEDLQKLVGLEL